MSGPQVPSPTLASFILQPKNGTKDDVSSLTSFNPFSEDENDQSSYTLVTSLLSRVKNTFTNLTPPPTTPADVSVQHTAAPTPPTGGSELRRPSLNATVTQTSHSSRNSNGERRPFVSYPSSNPAPPLVSLTPAAAESLGYSDPDYEPSLSSRSPNPFYSSMFDSPDSGVFGTAIPGFPIQDDTRSIKTSNSLRRSGSVSKAMRRIRGEGLSRDYWMDDENCKECYDCKSVFTTWRRKHHCRICGQIFCSRCASNIMDGRHRYGHNGMIRVCNLCKAADELQDDEDDRRSIVSSFTTMFPAHQLGIPETFTSGHHPQSPFAASQLFPRDEPFSLYSIAETRRPFPGSDDSGFGSRPLTPNARDRLEPALDRHLAPFRRDVQDEDKDTDTSRPFAGDTNAFAPGLKSPVHFPPKEEGGGVSSVQFPVGSPDIDDSPYSDVSQRHRFTSLDFDVSTPFIRSRVQSRLDSLVPTPEPGWRVRRESTAYAAELNLISMNHLKVMLRQMLTAEGVPHQNQWEETLLRLALRIAKELTFTTLHHRQGEDMDVRRYVKIKKVPGGTPQDSEYIDGAVITKNLAHKHMARSQRNPRIMLVTFPLEFFRVGGQYMRFDSILAQEKEYLRNLCSRIAALRPHLVLAENSVSRLVLDGLTEQNIAVARGVKPAAIKTVARMTQGDVFSSMDKLAVEPRLGHCARYRVQTFDHPLITGRRKTYLRFEGCSRDMGCTIMLRGANMDNLRRIKKVTRFLIFIVRNLKLETHLWKDSIISLPSLNQDAAPLTILNARSEQAPVRFGPVSLAEAGRGASDTTVKEGVTEEDLPDEDAEQLRLNARIEQSLEPYMKTFISVSATLRYPPPFPIRKMKELKDSVLRAKQAWEDEVVRREEKLILDSDGPPTATASQFVATPLAIEAPLLESATPSVVDADDIKAQIEALQTLSVPQTPTLDSPSQVTSADEIECFSGLPKATPRIETLFTTSAFFANALAEEGMEPTKTAEDIALESNYTYLKWNHDEYRRVWEWYLRKNRDDFVVEKYQRLSLLEYTHPVDDFGQHRPCFPPKLQYISFYGENDCTLGQFIEQSVYDSHHNFYNPNAFCTGKGCEQHIAHHCRAYVYNESRVLVAVERWDGQIAINSGFPDLITTWSVCRICSSATPFIPVSQEMQRYSFAKFLELYFYPADVKLVPGAGCDHNIYRHHVRYFTSQGVTIRFMSDPITLYEFIYPPFRIRVRPERQLSQKNKDFERLHYRNLAWYTSLIDDLKLISIDAATGDEDADARLLNDVNVLITRAEVEREDISRLINRIYRESAPTDTLALNQVHLHRQDKIVAWQQDFDRLPKPRTPQDRAGSRRASAFGSVRAMWPRKYEFGHDHPALPSSVSEAEEGQQSMRRVTGDSISSASEVSECELIPDTRPQSIVTVVPGKTERGETSMPCETPVMPIVHESNAEVVEKASDTESDSTVGATQDEPRSEAPNVDESLASNSLPAGRVSRLPRRPITKPSVAELVKRYQDYLPAEGMQDLARTAFPPRIVVSESEQEYGTPKLRRRLRSKSRHRTVTKKPSMSDFEQSYAANIAPRYLAHTRKSGSTRIFGPSGLSLESHESSRRPSPEKQHSGSRRDLRFVCASPTALAKTPAVTPGSKGKSRIGRGKDRVPSRPTSSGKSSFRRPTASSNNKVSTMAKHFEKLGRDAERYNRRYAVIRGRRARPVTSSRVKVEVLESVKDAMQDDEEDSSDSESSSEADDEGEADNENEEDKKPQDEPAPKPASSTTQEALLPDFPLKTAPPVSNFPLLSHPSTEASAPTPAASSGPAPAPGRISLPPSPFLSSLRQGLPSTPPPELDLGTTGTSSIFKALSGLWTGPSRQEFEADDPIADPEHIFRDSSMVVRIDEPTSIISLALNSTQYRDMLHRSRSEKRGAAAREARIISEASETFMPDDQSIAESTSTWGIVNVDPSELPDPMEDMKMPSSRLPWAISFESGGLTISCTVLYPEQFDALRRTYDCEKSMIESLARCVKWNASGGKSGSAFLKTRDDRFIAKELSKPELQTMETFAPAYFDYMSSAVSADRPTLLAKVFGCYKLTFKKTSQDKGKGKTKTMQMNLLVMENLFYDRRFSKASIASCIDQHCIYDLKGSTRNRHVHATGRENEVLLDENLIQCAHEKPFYVREHSKRILRGALHNDTKFLADINVMDYSLVCGVDSETDELVVGIVDYIRTYTWDKKLESWVKESAFLVSKGEPTIVTPKQYRQRFISAMERYFLLVPDRWMKEMDMPEEDVA
ncbi:hypothetical protein FISHEDRAFT_47454 [Fistulina hepatica ATCC 64428]|uniref:1-phosphatidylinositol-3-phosphate 5-kinase n=1 Tax=Fistulina hepatica ATCC 64428 TaxID=1128425 RepID=A0A0D7A7K9_9AGAR|nr:hypothetical protein FISHEDRAFT_47454 [Fistulina hepatica ATCC 64428]